MRIYLYAIAPAGEAERSRAFVRARGATTRASATLIN